MLRLSLWLLPAFCVLQSCESNKGKIVRLDEASVQFLGKPDSTITFKNGNNTIIFEHQLTLSSYTTETNLRWGIITDESKSENLGHSYKLKDGQGSLYCGVGYPGARKNGELIAMFDFHIEVNNGSYFRCFTQQGHLVNDMNSGWTASSVQWYDSLTLQGKTFYNIYALDYPQKPVPSWLEITDAYVQKGKGPVAFKNKDGSYWLRQ